MTTKSKGKPGYREQGKKRADGVKHNFAINKEQMERKALVQYYEKGGKYVKKKWKEKYGNDDVAAVLGYR